MGKISITDLDLKGKRVFMRVDFNVPMDKSDHGVTIEKVIHVMNRTGKYYSLGMRTYYFSVPLVLWLFGPLWMLVSSLALLAILNHLDHLTD